VFIFVTAHRAPISLSFINTSTYHLNFYSLCSFSSFYMAIQVGVSADERISCEIALRMADLAVNEELNEIPAGDLVSEDNLADLNVNIAWYDGDFCRSIQHMVDALRECPHLQLKYALAIGLGFELSRWYISNVCTACGGTASVIGIESKVCVSCGVTVVVD
jgi:hypothetical protein